MGERGTTGFVAKEKLDSWIKMRNSNDAAFLAKFQSLGTQYRGHRYFAGALQPEHYGCLVTCLYLVCMGGEFGDHRDWKDIEAWTKSIAQALVKGTPEASTQKA